MDLLDPDSAERRHHWTLQEYYQLAELQVFGDRRVELVGGTIYDMTPQGFRHSDVIMKATSLLVNLYSESHYVRVQLPLNAASDSAPEPDFVLLPKTSAGNDQPTWAELVIEVSESTLAFDLSHKLSLYAAAQVPEYWIVNLVKERLEVYRHPESDENSPFGSTYRDKFTFLPDEMVSTLFEPSTEIQVARLLGS